MTPEPVATPPYYDPPGAPFATQKCAHRAGIGRAVGARLDRTIGVWRLGSPGERPVQLYVRENFLSAEECSGLCTLIDRGCYPSPLYEKEKHEGVRTSQSCDLDSADPLVDAVNCRISGLLGIAPGFGEPLQGQKYEKGQVFKPHSDFFYVDQPYWADYEPHGGQRTWTAMIYLNVPIRGGATRFPLLGGSIQPGLGKILIWNNMGLDGAPNGWTQHEGTAVEEGAKYIVTKWFRERPFA